MRALGILGGMGPLATVDFMAKVIEATPAERDQDHIPLLVHAVPQVPDRAAAILNGTDEPLEWLVRGAGMLRLSGAGAIAIPCNTAHYWHDQLAASIDIPVLHIVDAAADALKQSGISGGQVGLLGTTGTIAAGVYQNRFQALGYDCLSPDDDTQAALVMGGIDAVKAGDLDTGRDKLEAAAETLRQKGCTAIVLGCTEVPIVLSGAGYIDATEALARASVAWHLEVMGKADAAE